MRRRTAQARGLRHTLRYGAGVLMAAAAFQSLANAVTPSPPASASTGLIAAATRPAVPAQKGDSGHAPGAAPPYVDRVLDGVSPGDADDPAQPRYDESGWARGLRFEYGLGVSRTGKRARYDLLRVDGWIETPDYGTFSVTAGGDRSDVGGITHSGGVRWRVDQRGFPMANGWQGHHSAGDVNAPLPMLAYGFSRVLLPPIALQGVAGSWSQGDRGVLNAAAGRSAEALLSLDPVEGGRAHGSVATAGGQWNVLGRPEDPSGRLDVAVQGLREQEARGAGGNISGQWAAASWQGQAPWSDRLGPATHEGVERRVGGLRVTAQWLNSADAFIRANGMWADAGWRSQELQQAAGIYRFEPGLRWGRLHMPDDLQGAYWRGEMSNRQWQVGATAEANQSLTGLYDPGHFMHAWGRWRLDSASALSGGVSVRTGDAWGRSLQAGYDVATDWASLLMRATILQRRRSQIVTLSADQTWNLQPGWALSTSLMWDRETLDGANLSRLHWGMVASHAVFGGPTFDLSLRGTHGNGQRSLHGSLNMNWPLQNEWSLSARAFVSSGREPQIQEVTSALINPNLLPPIPTSRGVQLSLRYETRAGTRSAPLGGEPGAGAGRITGTVFFDQNGNGTREASELPAAGVTVILDQRFSARTDAQGRYEFPAIVAGSHVIAVVQDNLPLPWMSPARDPVPVEVNVRSTATMDFALQRER